MLTSNNMVRTVLWICNLKRLGYDYEILTFLRRRSPFGYIEAPLQDLCNSLQMGGKEIPFRVSFGFPCGTDGIPFRRSEEHTSELQSRGHLVCRLLLEKKKSNTRGPVICTT